MRRTRGLVRWLMVVGAAGFVPAFILDCDKAALNFQRGMLEQLGENAADLVFEQVQAAGEEEA